VADAAAARMLFARRANGWGPGRSRLWPAFAPLARRRRRVRRRAPGRELLAGEHGV